MDPKKREEILACIDKQVVALNILSLTHYARLLQRCGVRKLELHGGMFLP